jgi:hypothetical protein
MSGPATAIEDSPVLGEKGGVDFPLHLEIFQGISSDILVSP